jgi:hypothetical protein
MTTDPFGATIGPLGLIITWCIWDGGTARAHGISRETWDEVLGYLCNKKKIKEY